MIKVKINGSNWKLRARMGAIRTLRSKYASELRTMDKLADVVIKGTNENSSADDNEGPAIEGFLTELVWLFVQPKLFFIKPYFTYAKFKERLEILELNEAAKMGFLLFNSIDPRPLQEIEDRKSGNVPELQRETG